MTTALAASILRPVSGRASGRPVALRRTLRIGRHPYNDISIRDPLVSRYHCWIRLDDGAPVLQDLKSGNGTFVNGERLSGPRPLRPGDRVRVGSAEFLVSESA